MYKFLLLLVTVAGLAACDNPSTADRGALTPSQVGQSTLCCVESACVQLRLGQTTCDAATEQRECEATTRLADVGPLWECRETSPVPAQAVTPDGRTTQRAGILAGTFAAPGAW